MNSHSAFHFARAAVPLLLLTTASGACRRDPNTMFARMLERAASWSASIQFTNEMARSQYVPPGYMHDVLSTAAQELTTLRQQIIEDDDMPPSARNEAGADCARLLWIVQSADATKTIADDEQLRAVEMRLRERATAMRSAAPASGGDR
jgi:hypothetical protein